MPKSPRNLRRGGMFTTHPPAAARKAAVEPVIASLGAGTNPDARTARFQDALAAL